MNISPVQEGIRRASPRKSAVHALTLAVVWLTVASSAVVFSEPAPFDVLMIGLILLLPMIGLTRFNAPILGFLFIWLIIGAAGFTSASIAHDFGTSFKHTLITLYLSIAAAVLAGFVAKNPHAHGRLIMNAYMIAATIASAAAIIGYFNLLPGFEKIFTLYGRARGTFKDPNVFGAFLVPAFLYCIHLWLTRPLKSLPLTTIGLTILSMGALLSFSRGAWAAMALAGMIYGYLIFVTTKRDSVRLKLVLLSLFGIASLILLVSIASQFDAINDVLAERASLDQSYDLGHEGRFGGQQKAIDLIITNPLGIGALAFGAVHHNEAPHNVYLSMFLNAGWIGGFGYLAIVLMTIILGFRHAVRNTPSQGLFIVVLAAFTATAAEGWIIDTDHWRHFFILLALAWGIMAGEYYFVRSDRFSIGAGRYYHPTPVYGRSTIA